MSWSTGQKAAAQFAVVVVALAVCSVIIDYSRTVHDRARNEIEAQTRADRETFLRQEEARASRRREFDRLVAQNERAMFAEIASATAAHVREGALTIIPGDREGPTGSGHDVTLGAASRISWMVEFPGDVAGVSTCSRCGRVLPRTEPRLGWGRDVSTSSASREYSGRIRLLVDDEEFFSGCVWCLRSALPVERSSTLDGGITWETFRVRAGDVLVVDDIDCTVERVSVAAESSGATVTLLQRRR